MRQKVRLVLAVAALASAACAVSQDQEVAIGRQNAEEINAKLPIVRDPVVSEYVQQLGLSIAKGTPRSDLTSCAGTRCSRWKRARRRTLRWG